MQNKAEYRRLPLDQASNMRDLGGYATPRGITKYHTFLRSDSISELSEEDQQLLLGLGLKRIVDLRRDTEVEENPDPMLNKLDYKNISFSNDGLENIDDAENVVKSYEGVSLPHYYVDLIKNKQDALVGIFSFLSKPGMTLFHCTAGKDRTGVIAALLLDLVGVSRSDIISDYSLSGIYILEQSRFNRFVTEGKVPEILTSKPHYIDHLLQYVKENYISTSNMLLEFGLSQAEINQIKQKLVKE
ncbi:MULTISPECIES: tyrosine-protein phosphatase [Aerococcus]|nr:MULTISPECIES: tyrosine-protein phosphatase [Aerococcus]KAA9299055.1 tyrosine-protein phosphatase [Aerococcus tenax]MDK6688220.1 tyrosine-protein phosphatase [Aerococcus urinae]MDK8132661.1 tyrosine-protein phosphatase [Aerococcus urinae]MDL5179298.1 tyrosine-protein phosphatase [Aerococcus tenax]MDL5208199.1 tyrosine-protein phosphatase [Aerococcus tenax]